MDFSEVYHHFYVQTSVSDINLQGDKESKLRFAFRIYDMDNDGYISNGELFQVLKMMVGNNLKDTQLQQIVDKTILFADKDEDGRISFEEFCSVSNIFYCPSRVTQHTTHYTLFMTVPGCWQYRYS